MDSSSGRFDELVARFMSTDPSSWPSDEEVASLNEEERARLLDLTELDQELQEGRASDAKRNADNNPILRALRKEARRIEEARRADEPE